jgi:hypothetical protein
MRGSSIWNGPNPSPTCVRRVRRTRGDSGLCENNGGPEAPYRMDGQTVTNQQLYLAIGVPVLFNAILLGLAVALINARTDGLNSKFDARFDGLVSRMDGFDRRLDELKELWRSELRRVEEVLDARLKHLEGPKLRRRTGAGDGRGAGTPTVSILSPTCVRRLGEMPRGGRNPDGRTFQFAP